jgi:hypothetical protein
MMGGDVTLTSEPGNGSVFSARLPVNQRLLERLEGENAQGEATHNRSLKAKLEIGNRRAVDVDQQDGCPFSEVVRRDWSPSGRSRL